MRGHKLRSNWQGDLKQKGLQPTGMKQSLAIFCITVKAYTWKYLSTLPTSPFILSSSSL
jgi:hypothetical protein